MKQKQFHQLKEVKQNQRSRSQQSEQSEDIQVGHQVQVNKLNSKKEQANKQNKSMVLFIYLLKLICFLLTIFVIFAICYLFYVSINGADPTSSNNSQNVNKTEASKTSEKQNLDKQQQLNLKNYQTLDSLHPSIRKDDTSKIMPNNQTEKTEPQTVLTQKQGEEKQINKQMQNISTLTSANLFALPQYSIKIKQFPSFFIDGESIKEYGIARDIQIGSVYDYLRISQSNQFSNFKQNWNKSVQYENYTLQKDLSIQLKSQILEYSSFSGTEEMQKQVQKLNQWKGKRSEGSYLPLYFSCHLVWNSSKALRELQLYYLTKKYNLNLYKEELPFCIFSTGYKIGSRERHKYFLDSIENQNYTNYRLILVDDGSTDNTTQTIYNYLKQKKLKLNNRVQLIKNKRNLGATFSTYYWSRQLCREGEIIVHIDMDDMLIGNQVLKVLNSLYHNPNTWYVYTRYLRQDNPDMAPNSGKSRAPNFQVKNYKHIIDWRTSALRSLRFEVMKNIPVQSVIQYHYDEDLEILFPKFYDTDADRFLIYPQLQLCGDHRIRYIDDVFYYYNITYQVGKKCNNKHEHFDEYKSRIKKVFSPMKQLNETSIRVLQAASQPTKIIKFNLKDRYQKYMKCLKQISLANNMQQKNKTEPLL